MKYANHIKLIKVNALNEEGHGPHTQTIQFTTQGMQVQHIDSKIP